MLLKEEEENDDNKIITTVEISDYETVTKSAKVIKAIRGFE